MGRFINELKKRGAYQYGSRIVGGATESSDWDWALPDTEANREWLGKCGFFPDGSYSHKARRITHRTQGVITKAITDLPGYTDERLQSFRKGNTNVVVMTPLALAGNKFATDMTAAHKELGETNDKQSRINLYQTYGRKYVKMMGIIS